MPEPSRCLSPGNAERIEGTGSKPGTTASAPFEDAAAFRSPGNEAPMMKRRGLVLFLVAAAFSVIPSAAAVAGRPKLLAGPAWGKYAADWDMSNVFKPGYLFGVGFEGGSSRLGYEIDALYILKTNRYPSRGWDYELGEISIPVLAKYKPFAGSTPFLSAGVEAAYVLSHKQKPGPFGEDAYDMMDNTRRMDFGLVFGAGCDLDLGSMAVELGGRYHHGLAKVSGLGSDDDMRTAELTVVLGLLF